MKTTAIKSLQYAVITAAILSLSTSAGWAAPATVPGTHPTIQAAVNDGSADPINVLPGVYLENVLVHRTVTINGAQAGVAVGTRTFAGPGEATVDGQITITAPDVTIDGFSITHAVPAFAASAVVIQGGGNGALISNNVIDTVTTPDVGVNGTAQGVYLQSGPDGVTISDNSFRNIVSNRSAKAILLGDNGALDAPKDTVIQGNTISNISSVTRGAYGISVANPAVSAGGVTGLKIVNNGISALSSGGWVHAIGLEGNTPSVVVEDNDISNLTDTGASDDNIGVFFESNLSFGTAEVHHNNFLLTTASYGIAVHPALTGGAVDATCNWWNSPSGPTIVSNPGGTGTRVGPNVTFSPWLSGPAPLGTCVSVASDKAQCKKGGWMNLIRADGTSFKNQGDCIQYVNTGK